MGPRSYHLIQMESPNPWDTHKEAGRTDEEQNGSKRRGMKEVLGQQQRAGILYAGKHSIMYLRQVNILVRMGLTLGVGRNC